MILPIAIALSETLELPEDANNKRHSLLNRHPQSDTIQMRRPGAGNLYLNLPSTDFDEEVFLPDQIDGKPSETLHKKHKSYEDGEIDAKQLGKVLQLSVAYGANIGGMATLIGSHPNVIFRMTIEK